MAENRRCSFWEVALLRVFLRFVIFIYEFLCYFGSLLDKCWEFSLVIFDRLMPEFRFAMLGHCVVV